MKECGSLTIARKKGEVVHIGKDITVEVRECRPGRATLKITAPKDVCLLRGEVAMASAETSDQLDALSAGGQV